MLWVLAIAIAMKGTCYADGKLTLEQQLIVACYKTDTQRVIELILEGANVNGVFGSAENKIFYDPVTRGTPHYVYKWTPLMALCSPVTKSFESNDLKHDMSESLLVINLKSEFGSKRSRDRLEICRILVSHRCNLDATDSTGKTALHLAAQGYSAELVKLLVDFGANPNIQTRVGVNESAGRTPLHEVAESDALSKYLIDHGANDDIVDSEGFTPRKLRQQANDVFDDGEGPVTWGSKETGVDVFSN